jgi:hypothetical protein
VLSVTYSELHVDLAVGIRLNLVHASSDTVFNVTTKS